MSGPPWSNTKTRICRRAGGSAAGSRGGRLKWNIVQDIVHIGRDGWLFLVGGSNNVLDQYREDAFPPQHFQAWRRLLEDRVRRARGVGARYFHVAVPEKLSILADHSDVPVDPDRAPSLALRRWLRNSLAWGSLIDLSTSYRSDPDRESLYLKTDSHWSLLGCHRAYLSICARMGVRPQVRLVPADPALASLSGDLGTKFPTHRSEVLLAWTYPRTAERVHVNAYLHRILTERGATGGGVGTQAVFRNEAPGIDPRRIILCGDSFAHHAFLPHVGTLTAMFAETFHEVYFFWATTVDWSHASELRPDFILTEIAERFMVTIPPADFEHDKFGRQMEALSFGS
ncbi:hypothetical protein ACFZ8E_25550 [Methylobacterium sp. HMF5984]|uniref:alginate O-acetyltransferase AlgX-related protein n=1 Tax=Methylobacterium sp. HMF5984 TaxID=3367370 RepID=UPI003851E63D